MMETVFKEKQQFRQWWIWLLLSPLILTTIYVVFTQLVLGNPVGDKPLPDFGVILLMLLTICIVFFMWYLRLETVINKTGIQMTYRPVLKKHYTWDAIEKAEILDYGFVGYGFRWSPKHRWIYNVGGNVGLKVYLKSGKHFIIGTQKQEELISSLSALNI